MDQDARALDVPQEIVSKTGALRCALDQTRNICQHHGCVDVNLCDAEIRLERGKRIRCDLWTGIRQHCEECGLSRVRDTDQADIGDQFEFQTKPFFLGRLTLFGGMRYLISRRRKVLVASPAATALEHSQFLARFC